MLKKFATEKKLNIVGINGNGFHFREQKTGIIFTLNNLEMYSTPIVKICSETGNEETRNEMAEFLIENFAKRNPFTIGDISLDQVYIAPKSKFEFFNFASDSVGIIHENLVKIALIQIVANNTDYTVETAFFWEHVYGKDAEVMKDLFELCEPNVENFLCGRFYSKTLLHRSFDSVSIQEHIYSDLEKNIMRLARKNISSILAEKNRISIKGKNEYTILNIYQYESQNAEKLWNVPLNSTRYSPAIKLAYVIMAMQQFDFLNKIEFYYLTRGMCAREKLITRESMDTALRDFIRISGADLEVGNKI